MYSYECGHCKKTLTIGQADIQPLSGVEKALCAKHDMDFAAMVKVVCPGCGQGSLVDKNKHLHKTGGSGSKKWWQFWKGPGEKKDPDQLYAAGQQHLLAGESAEALMVLQEALSNGLSGYKVCEAHLLLGAAHMRLGDRNNALKELREAEAINEERTGALRKELKKKGWL